MADAEQKRGSVEVGRRVRLPAGAERPIKLYVNGIEKTEGSDYSIHGSEVLFSKPIVKEQVSRARWLAMFIGLFGSYGENEVVDLHFRRSGKTEVRSDVEVAP
ncbi:MAG: hypothetical protein ACXWES_00270 [Solirubrobacterales bacterium]